MNLSTAFEQQWTSSLLPSSLRTGWARALEGVDSDLVARDPAALVPASRSDTDAPLAYLPHLASERSVNEFSSAWPEQRQRAVIADSFRFHQRQGTRPALDLALAPIGLSATVVEWFERELRPAYTFRLFIDLGDRVWRAADRAVIIRTANNAKSLHTKLERVEYLRRAAPCPVYVGGLVVRRRTLRIREVPAEITRRVTGPIYLGAAQRRRRTLRIKPRP